MPNLNPRKIEKWLEEHQDHFEPNGAYQDGQSITIDSDYNPDSHIKIVRDPDDSQYVPEEFASDGEAKSVLGSVKYEFLPSRANSVIDNISIVDERSLRGSQAGESIGEDLDKLDSDSRFEEAMCQPDVIISTPLASPAKKRATPSKSINMRYETYKEHRSKALGDPECTRKLVEDTELIDKVNATYKMNNQNTATMLDQLQNMHLSVENQSKNENSIWYGSSEAGSHPYNKSRYNLTNSKWYIKTDKNHPNSRNKSHVSRDNEVRSPVNEPFEPILLENNAAMPLEEIKIEENNIDPKDLSIDFKNIDDYEMTEEII